MLKPPFLFADRYLAHEPVRFVLAGGSAAAVFYLFTLVFIAGGAPPFAATIAAYGIAFVFSYSVQHAWTFRGRQAHRRSLPRYAAAQVAAALVAGLVARFCGDCGAPAAWVAGASTLSGSALSFLLSKFWVFASRGAPETVDV